MVAWVVFFSDMAAKLTSAAQDASSQAFEGLSSGGLCCVGNICHHGGGQEFWNKKHTLYGFLWSW